MRNRFLVVAICGMFVVWVAAAIILSQKKDSDAGSTPPQRVQVEASNTDESTHVDKSSYIIKATSTPNPTEVSLPPTRTATLTPPEAFGVGSCIEVSNFGEVPRLAGSTAPVESYVLMFASTCIPATATPTPVPRFIYPTPSAPVTKYRIVEIVAAVEPCTVGSRQLKYRPEGSMREVTLCLVEL